MRGANTYQHVDVIGSSVNDECRPFHLADDASEIREQIIAETRLDQRTPSLRRKNYMQQNVAESMRHRIFRPFRGFVLDLIGDPRLSAVGCILPPLRGCRIQLSLFGLRAHCDVRHIQTANR